MAQRAKSLSLLTRGECGIQGPIPLADAAAALIGSDVASHKRPQAQITVERRLYDIGSILSSVGLIEKTYLGKRWGLQPLLHSLFLLLAHSCLKAP